MVFDTRPSSLSGAEVNGCLEEGAAMQEARILKRSNGVDRSASRLVEPERSKAPHFTMREYVLAVRREDLKKTWPFSQKHLRLWLDRGKEPLLPPLDPPRPSTLFRSQAHHDCQQNEWEIISKEEQSFDAQETEPQVSSKEGSTLPESEFHLKAFKTRNLSEKQWPILVPANCCNIVEDISVGEISCKHPKRHRQFNRRRKRNSKWKVGKKLLETRIQSLDRKRLLNTKIRSVSLNCLGHELLRRKGHTEVKVDNTSVDSSKEDTLVDSSGKAGTDMQGEDLSPHEKFKVVKHKVETTRCGKECSSNSKAEAFSIDIQTQESTSSLLMHQKLKFSNETDGAQGKSTSFGGELSKVEYRVWNPKDSEIESDLEDDTGMVQSREELVRAPEGKAEYSKENIGIARKELAKEEEKEQKNEEKVNRHDLTEEITNVLENSPDQIDDIESGKRGAEFGSGALISDSLTPKVCPVCLKFASTSNTALNAHIDRCLTVGSPLLGDPVRLQKYKPKQKIRSIADICAKASTNMPDQKTTKHWNSTLSSCILDSKGRRIKHKRQISALKPYEMRKKVDSVKEASKRRRTMSDLEDNRKHKRITKRGKPRSNIGMKRKQQQFPAVDSDNHFSWDATKSTSATNLPSKVENSETPGRPIPCELNRVAQSPLSLPQASRLMKKQRADSRRCKKNLKEGHVLSEHSNLVYGKFSGLSEDPNPSSSNNKVTWLPPAEMVNGMTTKARDMCSKNDKLQMGKGQPTYSKEINTMEALHPYESETSVQDSEKKRGVSSNSNGKTELQSQSTGRKLSRKNIGIEKDADVAQAQISETFDNVQVGLSAQTCLGPTIMNMGSNLQSKTLEGARSIGTSDLSSMETMKGNMHIEHSCTEVNNETAQHRFGNFMRGHLERGKEDANQFSPSTVTMHEAVQRSKESELKEMLNASNRNNFGKNGKYWQPDMEGVDQHLENSGGLKLDKITRQPKLYNNKEMLTSTAQSRIQNKALVLDMLHAGLLTDTNGGQAMLNAEMLSTGIGVASEQITVHSVSAPLYSSSRMDCLKSRAQTGSLLGTSLIAQRNLQDANYQNSISSSITKDKVMLEEHSSCKPLLKGKDATIGSHVAAERETEVTSSNAGDGLNIVKESVEKGRPLVAGCNQTLNSIYMGLPSVSCSGFHDRVRNQQASMCSRQDPLNSAALSGITASMSIFDSSTGMNSKTGSWTAAVKMASLGTQLWNMPGGAYNQFQTSANNGSASEVSQLSGDCSKLIPAVGNTNSPSASGSLSSIDSLCTTTSPMFNNSLHMRQNPTMQGNALQVSCHHSLASQGSLSTEETSWASSSNFKLKGEETHIQGNGHLGSYLRGLLPESHTAPFQTTPPDSVQSSADFSPGWLIENSTMPETKQLLLDDQRYSPFNVLPDSGSSGTQENLSAQRSSSSSVLSKHSVQPAVIHIFGQPIFVLGSERANGAHSAKNQSEMLVHKESACEMIALHPDKAKQPLQRTVEETENCYNCQNVSSGIYLESSRCPSLPSARTNFVATNGDLAKPLYERLDGSMGEAMIVDDAPLSESLPGKLLPDMFFKAESHSRKDAPSLSASFLSLDYSIQDPTSKGNHCPRDDQISLFSKAVQPMESNTGPGTSNLFSSPNFDLRKDDSLIFPGLAKKSHSYSKKSLEGSSYCCGQASLFNEPKPISMGVDVLSSRICHRNGHAGQNVTTTNSSNMQPNLIVIVDDDDDDERENVVYSIRSAKGQVSQFRHGALAPVEAGGRLQRMKQMASSFESSIQMQQVGPKAPIPGSNLEHADSACRHLGQNLLKTTSNMECCDTSMCEAQLNLDGTNPSPTWMKQKRGTNSQAFEEVTEMVKAGLAKRASYHSFDRSITCKQGEHSLVAPPVKDLMISEPVLQNTQFR
ncbi:hypothetical protein O6H91_07G090000 [Diphasiastrum complanatum]|nr:hypothetical protein O6H91_07G090000 [Diphasiastrum complanatum]KAJ7550243.1 hypothetical protein O6H91_07G090000 [Diphasiastrum complanatum]KAJ7550244.1 hypothetical protein O6H91_07G090000 [Diphasiastrum complanatum]